MPFLKFILIALCMSIVMTACKEATQVKEESKYIPLTREKKIESYASVVKMVAPAVVNIYAFHQAKFEYPASPFMDDPFFKQFFEHLHPGENEAQNSLGSGTLVNKEGLVLTNDHVIENADMIHVVLFDKREYVATVVVRDKKTDLALLQIEGGTNFPFLTINPSEDIEVGDVVLAIGNPFGVGQTVTSGIISALARSQEGISDYRSFIQTDAAINPGNSGGPLVTTDGRVVGINTAIYSKSGGSVGIGFAIPTNIAMSVIESVKNEGRIIRPWLGLEVQSVTADDAHALGLSRPYGVLVKEVYPEGPADKAGVKVGDFIAALDHNEIEDDASLDYQVAISPLGKKVDLTILRKGEKKKLSIMLTEPMDSKDSSSFTIEEVNPLRGARIQTLSPSLAVDLGLNPMQRGVVITEVSETGPAAQLGIQPGDVLEFINKKKIKTKEDAMRLLKNATREWTLILRRGDQVLTFEVTG